ncbi:MAG TPA: fluoride efflux transporter CrcB [Steroidobacteraceae bacterium]|nr:fluoride efflux transporter CrcB [Steroidobacteraceae bacterium]
MQAYVLIAFGSALGGVARYWCSSLIAERVGETFPWGTWTVNVAGSFLIGVLAGFAAPEGRIYFSPELRQFLMIGVLGGFTTFSSFSVQTLMLIRDGDWLAAIANVLLSVAACLLAVWAGYALSEAVVR